MSGPSPTIIIQLRKQREANAWRKTGRLTGIGCSLALALLLALGTLGAVAFYSSLTTNLPSHTTLQALLDPDSGALLQPTRIYDQTGEHQIVALQNPADPGREFLDLDTSKPDFLPTSLVSATLAASDPDFWHHPGAVPEVIEQSLAERLASELMLWDEPPGMRRTLRQKLLALQITAIYGRPQVMSWFLNSANYGRLVYGAGSAAQVYFGKPARQLSLVEVAVLAAAAEAPSLNPHDSPQTARQRGSDLLGRMLTLGLISPLQYSEAMQEDVEFAAPGIAAENLAPDYVSYVITQVEQMFSRSRLERGGYRLITSLDYDLQTQSLCAVTNMLSEDNGAGPALPVLEDGSECHTARLLQAQPADSSAGLEGLGASVVILEPDTGRVLAMVGDNKPGLDALQEPGQPPGTLLTPFLYLSGFTRGLSPASLFWDIPENPSALESDLSAYHGPVRLRTALANDYLAVAEQVLDQIGPQYLHQLLQEIGVPSDTIGQPESMDTLTSQNLVNLLDVSQAYGVLANQGILVGESYAKDGSQAEAALLEPIAFLELTDLAGTPLLQVQNPISRPVISPQLAYLITDVLSDEPARWESLGHPNPLEIGRTVAAKLGMTKDGKDTWAVGYTPSLVVGSWVGQKDQSSNDSVPKEMAASLWHAIMQYATRNHPTQAWHVPQGISSLLVCDPSGMLPTSDCPQVVNEIFLSGSEPNQPDTLFRKLQINRETGLLATIFTPPELVEERTYLIVPPEASEWARLSGLETPPRSFDTIPSSVVDSGPRISSPGMFDHVRGKVSIRGSTGEGEMAFYRLQVGKGLNPRVWQPVGEESTKPVSNGILGIWDTEDASGLYGVQLLVVYSDQRVDTAMIHVTVDNQPPEVEVIYPLSGQEIDASPGDTITLRAKAIDDLAVQQVEFTIDGQPVAVVAQAPYSTVWTAAVGEHTLNVTAVDKAGNSHTASVTFTVK